MQKRKDSRSKVIGTTQKRAVVGKKRVLQLICSICLFLAVFVGRETKILEENQSGQMILQAIKENTDFKAMFQKTGEVFAENIAELKQLEKMGLEVWKPEELQPEPNGQQEENSVISEPIETADVEQEQTEETADEERESDAPQDDIGVGVPETQLKEDTAAPEISPYTGPALPANASMEYFELELAETVTPVLGRVTSPYGYRDDPLASGEDEFHVGVDLSAEVGTPILSFAAGTVEFIGESSGYGLYIQIDHGNGISTFYCHCSQLCMQKGMQVSAGQVIAKTGDTGNTTGPHLHMELRRNGVLLNPEYYIEVLPA